MTARISITESNIMQSLGDFLTDLIGIEIVNGLDNMVPEPGVQDFAVMTPILHKRLAMNTQEFIDCSFIGSVLETTLTVDSVSIGSIVVGSQLFGPTVLSGTDIVELVSPGVYKINKAQTIELGPLACGNEFDLSPREVTVQVDIHGPLSSEKAILTEAMFRSTYGFDNFKESGFDIRPLYCSDPRQIVFNNAEQQNEKRWSIDCTMQVNPLISIPQQFMAGAEVELIEVDTTYPAQ